MINVGGVRIGLRRTDTARRAVIPANAARIVLGQIHIVSQKNGEGVWLNSQISDQRVHLRIEPVDIHQSRVEPEHNSRLAVPGGRAESLLCQHSWSTQ